VLEKCATKGIHIGVRVLDLSNCAQNTGNRIKALSGKITDVVILNVLICEVLKMKEPGISVSQDCMSISGNDLALAEGLADILFDDCFAGSGTLMVILEFSKPL
jgi:hypothetical protein